MFNDTTLDFPTDLPLAVLEPEKEPRLYTLGQYLKREARN